MRPLWMVLVATGILLAGGCGEQGAPPASRDSGITGTVHLGPQCPVETLDDPCDDKPAAGVTVTVSKPLPGEAYVAGEAVARGTTDTAGAFRIAVAPGEYVVTAEAGMSCELMDARVTGGSYVEVDVPCDTGIR